MVDSVGVGLQARVLCKITMFGLALHVHVGQRGHCNVSVCKQL